MPDHAIPLPCRRPEVVVHPRGDSSVLEAPESYPEFSGAFPDGFTLERVGAGLYPRTGGRHAHDFPRDFAATGTR